MKQILHPKMLACYLMGIAFAVLPLVAVGIKPT